jgi:hypothetical protein
MSRHGMFPGVSRPERGVSAHALDAANVLVISIRWTSQNLCAIAKQNFAFLVSFILLLCARAKAAVDSERVAYTRVTAVQRRKTWKVYETRLSGTIPMPASVSNCPPPPRGFSGGRHCCLRRPLPVRRYYRTIILGFSNGGIVEGYSATSISKSAPRRVFDGRCSVDPSEALGQNQSSGQSGSCERDWHARVLNMNGVWRWHTHLGARGRL